MMSRILIFTGKGGVGKTSVAAAHARYSSLEGKKTLIVSTDMAHNLSDIFGVSLGKTTCQVEENLFALEIDPNHMMENEFGDMKNALINMIRSSGAPISGVEHLSVLPGMDELFSLLKILEIYETGDFERIIVDCAPTGETIAMLKIPELLSWYMEKFLPVGKVALRVLAPISKAAFKIELPNKAAISDVEKMFLKLAQLQALFKNREVTSIRIVAIPEKMVVEETKRNYMYMNLYNFQVDGLYINRILPSDIDNPFFNEWIEIQHQYIDEYEMIFGEIPIYKIPWFDTDLNGLSGIDLIAKAVLKNRDVFSVIKDIQGETYEKVQNGYILKLNLPCVEKADVKLHESLTDIILKIGNFKRNIPKPSTLRNHEITNAQFDEGILTITLLEK
ncbi:ArsA family ATPase [Fusibacter sp. 3D3]|uniref:ArsA family ATPase n=1 Tax=Fusibacter sp. 3D3 TaxID=1048380 RepID=UPI000858B43D|nr:ArsA family ATPase [Fusibacter sp. 3D3]GAU76029.1 arsenical pump-driving ATPase [Fusibacter sp. 3D3]